MRTSDPKSFDSLLRLLKERMSALEGQGKHASANELRTIIERHQESQAQSEPIRPRNKDGEAQQ